MMITPEAIKLEFPDRDSLLREINARDEKISHLGHKIQDLEEQLAWFKRQIFGKRSERVVSNLNSQQMYFEGFEK